MTIYFFHPNYQLRNNAFALYDKGEEIRLSLRLGYTPRTADSFWAYSIYGEALGYPPIYL